MYTPLFDVMADSESSGVPKQQMLIVCVVHSGCIVRSSKNVSKRRGKKKIHMASKGSCPASVHINPALGCGTYTRLYIIALPSLLVLLWLSVCVTLLCGN